MHPKSKSKDKSKALKTKSKSPKSQNPTKLLVLAISFTKPIESWYEVAVADEEVERSSQVQNWVESLSNSPKLLLALQIIDQKSSQEEKSSQASKPLKPISKKEVGSSSQKPLLLFNSDSPFKLSQKLLKEKSDNIEKLKFQNVLTIKNGFFPF
jgi:hypothetical protein